MYLHPVAERSLEESGRKVYRQVVTEVIQGEAIDLDADKAQVGALEYLKTKARIFVAMLYPSELTQFLHNARKVGMMNGEYVFIGQLDTMDPSLGNPLYEGMIGAGMYN